MVVCRYLVFGYLDPQLLKSENPCIKIGSALEGAIHGY